MKLSEVKGEKALDMFADLLEPIAEIIDDKEVTKLWKNRKGMSTKQVLAKTVSAAIKTHTSAVMQILATLDGVPVEEYECNILSLPKKALDILNDPAIFELFTLQGRETSTPSGSVTGNTTVNEN